MGSNEKDQIHGEPNHWHTKDVERGAQYAADWFAGWLQAKTGRSDISFQNDGPKILNRAIGFGTQTQAAALKGTARVIGKVGKGLGIFGYGLQATTLTIKLVNGEKISTAEKVGFGVSTFLIGAAWVAGTTVLAPWVAGAALVYGGAELISLYTTGESLETNILGKE